MANAEPLFTTAETTLSPEASRCIAKIRADLEQIPETPATQIYRGGAQTSLAKAKGNEAKQEDDLFFAGLNTACARIISGTVDDTVRHKNGVIVVNATEEYDPNFARLVIETTNEGILAARANIPAKIQAMCKEFHTGWFTAQFGMPYTEALMEQVIQPIPIVVPFDHFGDRAFVGGIMHYPENFNSASFAYMKVFFGHVHFFIPQDPKITLKIILNTRLG